MTWLLSFRITITTTAISFLLNCSCDLRSDSVIHSNNKTGLLVYDFHLNILGMDIQLNVDLFSTRSAETEFYLRVAHTWGRWSWLIRFTFLCIIVLRKRQIISCCGNF
eukprot:GFYU01020265.1.p2 GENE.GFYU01020265.1~~GFYU01020265.1.p2  ORF type:complete len:108 (+),score=0.14 GFYU01020265.1:154-477(+)